MAGERLCGFCNTGVRFLTWLQMVVISNLCLLVRVPSLPTAGRA